MNTVGLKTAVQSLIQLGEYRLACQTIRLQYKILKLTKAKQKHNREWKKTMDEATKIHEEVAVKTARIEMENL